LEDFTANYGGVHDQLPDIRQGLSSEELKYLPAERFRFIHIDGGHEWSTVSEDVDQVRRLLSPGGVVAFDDVFNFGCAGVGAAVWPACASGDLVPIATTNEKLYATRRPSSSVSAASMTRVVEEDSELHKLDPSIPYVDHRQGLTATTHEAQWDRTPAEIGSDLEEVPCDIIT
jgi:hypothetical protein